MLEVLKRNGKTEKFDKDKIVNAIISADVEEIDADKIKGIAKEVEKDCKEMGLPSVNDIHDFVEQKLMAGGFYKTAKNYIEYRSKKNRLRKAGKERKYKFLSEEFLSKYKHLPDPLNEIASFTFYRTYSRYLPEEGRRERFWESIARAVDYNISLSPYSTKEEAEELFDNIYHGRQQLSGRTLFTGGSPVSKISSLQNFNCSFTAVDDIYIFGEMFYVLMLGVGIGIGAQKKYVNKLPEFRTDISLVNKQWTFVEKKDREDVTQLTVDKNVATLTIGDSKEGFHKALDFFMEIHTQHAYKIIDTIIIDYDYVRPAGERLMKFGGFASGSEPLQKMFNKIHKVITKSGGKLKPIDVMDICTSIAENVVSGAVRRSACISFIDPDDEEMIHAKDNIYVVDEKKGEWKANEELLHRMMSNNSIIFDEKPTREKLKDIIQTMVLSAEPGIINGEAARKRFPEFAGTNACGEILLKSRQCCNLTSLNISSFVDEKGSYDLEKIKRAQELSARAGYRMTLVDLELPTWDRVQKEHRLTGCGITGWKDFVERTNITKEEQEKILSSLREVAHKANKEIAKTHNLNESTNVTTVAPNGTLGLIFGGVSPGVHASHAPFFIRRIRISAADPLVKVCEELGWVVKNEVGQEGENVNTKVVEFPVESGVTRTKSSFTAVEQLETYKMFQDFYTDQNTSITVTVKPDEWDDVEEWLWNNWDSYVGISFLPDDGGFYQLMPYEAISEEEYNVMKKGLKPFNPNLIQKYEKNEEEFEDLELDIESDPECASGVCPIR